MKILRFDKQEFEVLTCSKNGMYSWDSSLSQRAKLLMKEKILKNNPLKSWSESGWKLTSIGKEYYIAFMKKVQKSHGHVWELNNHNNSDDDSDYGKSVNIFAYEIGYHNGPRCVNCGYEFCHHCLSEFNIPKCPRAK